MIKTDLLTKEERESLTEIILEFLKDRHPQIIITEMTRLFISHASAYIFGCEMTDEESCEALDGILPRIKKDVLSGVEELRVKFPSSER